jgi:DTW domain-containing protein YfiP
MTARTTCLRCRRPEDRCVCALGARVDNRTGVTVLQHPGERRHAFGTARLARAALRNLELHVLWPDRDGRLRYPGEIPPGAALLYPRPDAVELGALPEPPSHLVVLDGTWPQARVVYRDNPWLAALPHVQLSPARPSRYRIRREPAPHCLSTIESIGEALATLEPDTPGLQGLLDSFVAMVDGQADQDVVPVRRRKVRDRPSVIERLAAGWPQVVLGYAESEPREGARSLSRWAAVRPCTLEVFEGSPGPSLAERWATFAGPDVLLACWSPSAGPLLAGATGRPVQALSLRAAYGNVRRGARGYLDELVRREGWPVPPVPIPGPAGERLGYAVALATFLKDLHGRAPGPVP